MPKPEPHVRRATLEDIDVLRGLWSSMQYDGEALARRVTEFQVVEMPGQGVVGAVGFHILQKQGWIHSEAYTDFALADDARPLLWERLKSLAANHGVIRFWTREQAPFWRHAGLAVPDDEALQRLPQPWREMSGWTTLKLREDVDEILSADHEIAVFMQTEKRRTQEIMARAKVVKTVATVVAMILLAGVILAALYLLRYSSGWRFPGR